MEFPVHIPFVELLGFELLRWENDEAEIRFDARSEHQNSFSVVHGGALMTLLDVAMALVLRPKLLIMDEPTSVLTPQEVEQLFVVLRQLASEGCSILYISHKLHEIKALCDTATILRGGKLVDTCDPRQETSRSMAEKMIEMKVAIPA